MRQTSLDTRSVLEQRPYAKRRQRESAKITITPLRGFCIALLFLGIPTVSLGSLCLSLIQNNLRLSEKNDELAVIASEVKADIDLLGEEIEYLQARAGTATDEDNKRESEKKAAARRLQSSRLDGPTESADPATTPSVRTPRTTGDGFPKNLPPRGGPAKEADALALLKDAQQKVPVLSQALDTEIKPALEETLAKEAAYPDGQPVVGKVEVSSEFGIRGNPFGWGGYEMHEGIDFAGEHGDIIAATGDGKITRSGYNGGYGIVVTIDHGNDYETLYAHMSETKVDVGETVKRGQIIGYIGSTGRSSGPHLHYSIYRNEKAINPRELLKLED